jgi:hypothetical protein
MAIPKYYLGNGFKVWTRERAWFWFVASPFGDGGTVGTASKAEAIRAEAIRAAARSSVAAASDAGRGPAQGKR